MICNSNATTTGKPIVAECRLLCRVPKVAHSAKRPYTECYIKGTRQSLDTRQLWRLPSAGLRTHGKRRYCRVLNSRHTTNVGFAKCWRSCTRQREHVPAMWLGTVPIPLRSQCLPSVSVMAHGKVGMCRVLCSWHSAKYFFAECQYADTRQTKKKLLFYLQNFLLCYYTSRGTTYRILVYFSISYVYVINLFH